MAATRHNCLNHPGVPAVSHCVQCHRPVCADCIAATDGDAVFCSEQCQNVYRSFRYAHDAKRPRGPGWLAGLMRLAILLAALAGLVYAGRWLGLGFCERILKFLGL